ncbi:MAG: serine/threonine protein kinase [Sandaracinus sp.]|nr:serine/threonine protein kinase [Sandaracinus sp.]
MQNAANHLHGTVIGDRYRVVRELGGGGMGTVYEVEHVDLGRPFALKVLRLGARNDELEQRFRREARALAMVRSPRVAQVTDFGIDPVVGTWYVMELVAGESLEDRLVRDGALPPAEALPILAEVAEAIADVHDASLVHRDLKPSNIGLPSRGPLRAQLLDFGLAASIDDAFLTRITQSQQVLGSLPYIAPESFSGTRPSVAADLWSLGIVIYETLSGRLPFDAPSTAALMHAILTAPAPRLDGFPTELGALLRALLDKEPTKRPDSARVVAERLRAATRTSLPPTLAIEPMPRTRAMPSAEHLTPPGARTEPLPAAPSAAPVESSIRLTTRGPRWGLWAVVGVAIAVATGIGVAVALDAMSVDEPVPTAAPPAEPIAAPEASDLLVETETQPPAVAAPVEAADSVPAPQPTTEPTVEATPSPRATGGPRRRPRTPESREDTATPSPAPAPAQTMAPTGWRGGIIEDLE